jgi:hypothetical protein
VATNPLFEVFGFPFDNMTEPAKRHREHRLCPFNNKVPICTKDKVYCVLIADCDDVVPGSTVA